MKRAACPHASLQPGEHCRITEAEWFDVLESVDLLHQWGSALLVADDADAALVRAYWRDDSSARRHTAWRFDGATSEHVRENVAAIEQASSQVATLLAQAEARGSSTIEELAAQSDASEAFTHRAEDFYRELLRLGPKTS